MESFLLKHAALVEAMVMRARAGVECAYTRPGSFASLMFDIYQEVCRWLSDLLTGATLETYLWHTLSRHILTKPTLKLNISNTSLLDFTKTKSDSSLVKLGERKKGFFATSGQFFEGGFKGLAKCDKYERQKSDKFEYRQSLDNLSVSVTTQSSLYAENFVRELCELLESVDVKHTNL